MTTLDNTLPAAPRHRIRWLQRLAVAGSVGAVLLLLALVWQILPAWLDPAQTSPATGRPQHPVAVDTCAREFIDNWVKLSPIQRKNDTNRQPLRQKMQDCSSRHLPGLVEAHLLKTEDGTPEMSLQGTTEDFSTPDYLAKVRAAKAGDELRAPSGSFTDRVYPVDSTLVLVERYLPGAAGPSGTSAADAMPVAVHQEQWLLSALALGLVALVGVSLRWLGRSQRDYQRTLQEAVLKLEKEAQARQAAVEFRLDMEESISVGLRVIDHEGQITHVNRAFCETLGMSSENLMGRRAPYPFWPADQVDTLGQHLRDILNGEAGQGSYRATYKRLDGTLWRAQVGAHRLRSRDGWIFTSIDVTSQEEAQKSLDAMNAQQRTARRLNNMGLRLGGLLHKLSNHSGAYTTAIDGLSKHMKAGHYDAFEQGVGIAQGAALDMAGIIEKYRDVLRNEAAKEPSLLHETVADAMLQVSSMAAQHNVVMDNAVSKALPPVLMERVLLWDVLSNLLHNAISAMVTPPTVTPILNRRISVTDYLDEDAGQVQIRVRDRGPGVPIALREQIFAQGFTTRPGGTGWGLYSSRLWVEEVGGSLVVEDNLPRGADFVITLPLTSPSTHDASAHDASAQPTE